MCDAVRQATRQSEVTHRRELDFSDDANRLAIANRLANSKGELVDVEGFDLPLECLAWNAEPGRRTSRTSDPSLRRRKRSLDEFFLTVGKRHNLSSHSADHLTGFPFEPGLIDLECLALAQLHRELDHILQLAHVPGPVVRFEQLQRLLLDVTNVLARLLRVARDEVLDQHGDVVRALT